MRSFILSLALLVTASAFAPSARMPRSQVRFQTSQPARRLYPPPKSPFSPRARIPHFGGDRPEREKGSFPAVAAALFFGPTALAGRGLWRRRYRGARRNGTSTFPPRFVVTGSSTEASSSLLDTFLVIAAALGKLSRGPIDCRRHYRADGSTIAAAAAAAAVVVAAAAATAKSPARCRWWNGG